MFCELKYHLPLVVLLTFSSWCNSVIKTNMVFTRKKRQSNRRLLSHLDDFDQNTIIGKAVSEKQENVVVNEGTNDRNFTVDTSSNDSTVNGNAMSVKTLERCFNERTDRELSIIVDTVEDRIQNAILTSIENIVALKIELAIRSINASSGRDATSVSANSERREHVGISTSFENASGNNDTLGVSNVNDETRQNIPDEVSELSVSETRFDRQPQTHHRSAFPIQRNPLGSILTFGTFGKSERSFLVLFLYFWVSINVFFYITIHNKLTLSRKKFFVKMD